MITYRHTSFYCASPDYTSQIFAFFTNWKFLATQCQGSLSVPFFLTAFAPFLSVFVSHFDNLYNISNFIIVIFVMVICGQSSLMLVLQNEYDSLKVQMMVNIF